MHSKRLRRRLHAARAPRRRDDDDADFGENVGAVVVGGLTLTGPITLTLISTLPSSTQSSTSLSSTSNTVQSTMTLTSSSSSSSTTSNAASQTPSTSTPPASTPVPSVILPAVTSAGGSGKMLQSGALSTTKIPAGGIVGVVIGCLIVLAAGLFFLLRSRSRRGRMKLRNTWTTRNAPVGIRSSQYEPKPFVGDSVSSDMSPEMRFAPPPPPQMHPNPLAINILVSSNMPAPPPSYNNPDVYDGIAPLSAVLPRASRVLSPTSVYSPTSAAISPSSATVVCTFIVTLPDELSIKVGEIVRILAEYDDGWVLCMNADGEQGMVPLECLSRGRPTASSDGGLIPPMLDRDARGARRVSSLGPSASALKVYTT